MMSRLLRSLWLPSIVILSGCDRDPNPGGPSVAPRESVKAPSGDAPALQPGSLSEMRRQRLQKTDGGPAPESAK
jgi:hypothetical protein